MTKRVFATWKQICINKTLIKPLKLIKKNKDWDKVMALSSALCEIAILFAAVQRFLNTLQM